MGTDGEKAALVSERGLYTEENGNKDSIDDDVALESETETPSQPHTVLGQFHEDALTQVGFGSFQWWICFTVGLCFMVDSVQVFITPFIEPSVQSEMCLHDDDKKLWISGIFYLGLMLGSLACPLADHIGRISLLRFAITIHIIFNIASAFSPTFGVFMTTRFCSSFGLGICYPVASVYFAEYLPKTMRGKMSYVLLFWACGGIFGLLLTNTLLPATGPDIVDDLKTGHFSWHRVLLVSMIPSFVAFTALWLSPESVRYLLQHGRDVTSIMIYQNMYRRNASRSAQYQLTELELPSKVTSTKPPPAKTVWGQMTNNIKQFFDSLKELRLKRNICPLLILSVAWGSMGLGYYGIGNWVPGILQGWIDDSYDSKAVVYSNIAQVGHLYVNDMENIKFQNSSFLSCTFAHITMSHVVFNNCILNNTDFSNIVSSKTYFNNSVIINSRLVDTDFDNHRFFATKITNTTIISYEPPCLTDLDFKFNRDDLLSENTVKLICPFAAFIFSISFFGNLKRSTIAALGLLLCGSIPLSWYIYLRDITSLLLFDFVWNFMFLITFTALSIITVEAFPVEIRATGFGICFACFRGLALCVTMHPIIAFPGTVIAMVLAGIASIALSETTFNLM